MPDPFEQVYSYKAGGQTVTLKPDKDYVGVALDQLDETQVASLEDAAKGKVQKINEHAVMVCRKDLPKFMLDPSVAKHAIFPVFKEGEASIIALPEVRVEPPVGKSAAAGMKSLGKWLGEHEDKIQVVAEKGDRVVLAPVSGYGPDAVSLAHDITKKFKSLTASPRFLRILPKPKTA